MRGDPSASDARETVLACASRLLDESGQEGLTIRRLASESGFTPPAIYSLFGDKAGLIEALVERSFLHVIERMQKIEDPGDGRDYARLAFREIVNYGREHRHHFQLLEERIPAAALDDDANQARFRLSAPLMQLAGTTSFPAKDVELMRQVFWSLLHGLITLPPIRGDVEWQDDLADAAFEVVLGGFLATRGELEGGAAA